MKISAEGVVAVAVHEPTQMREILLDPPGSGEVLVRLRASGVCHSDIHYTHGQLGDEFPFLLGHEGAGVIEEAGAGIDQSRVGDFVALSYRAPCGTCRFCLQGETNRCVRPAAAASACYTSDGARLTRALDLGTFATHIVVAAQQAIAISPECPPAQAALLGCGVSTGIGAVFNTASVTPGSTVAVFGCGGVGLNVIQGARLARASRIIAVDLEERKLEWAHGFGATDTVNAATDDPVGAIRELTDGLGVDYAFDVVGAPGTTKQCVESIDYRSTVILVGFPATDTVMELPMQPFFYQGTTYKVCLGGETLPSRDIPLLVDWYLRGDLDLDGLVTNAIDLNDVESVFAAIESGTVIRSVIRFPDELAPVGEDPLDRRRIARQ